MTLDRRVPLSKPIPEAISAEYEAQAQRIADLEAALRWAFPRLCNGCDLRVPYTPDHYEGDNLGFAHGVGEGDSHVHPRGGIFGCGAWFARRALASGETEQ